MDLEIPNRLPIIPLVSSVLFPGSGDKENPRPEDLSQIGVLAAIVQRLPLSSDRYQLFLQGRQRVELV